MYVMWLKFCLVFDANHTNDWELELAGEPIFEVKLAGYQYQKFKSSATPFTIAASNTFQLH